MYTQIVHFSANSTNICIFLYGSVTGMSPKSVSILLLRVVKILSETLIWLRKKRSIQKMNLYKVGLNSTHGLKLTFHLFKLSPNVFKVTPFCNTGETEMIYY